MLFYKNSPNFENGLKTLAVTNEHGIVPVSLATSSDAKPLTVEQFVAKMNALTLGDPAGIGPEITVKALRNPEVQRSVRAVVIADRAVLERTLDALGLAVELHAVIDPEGVDQGQQRLAVDAKVGDQVLLRRGAIGKTGKELA